MEFHHPALTPGNKRLQMILIMASRWPQMTSNKSQNNQIKTRKLNWKLAIQRKITLFKKVFLLNKFLNLIKAILKKDPNIKNEASQTIVKYNKEPLLTRSQRGQNALFQRRRRVF